MRISIKRVILLAIILIFMGVTACTRVTEMTQASEPLANETAYPTTLEPVKVDENDEQYPVTFGDTLSDLPATLTVPEPVPGMAVVTGKVLSISEGNGPFLNASLYLGSYISPNEGGEDAPQLVGISPGIDPMAQQAQDGTFVFVDVPPGSYGLFIYTPMSAFLMSDAKTGEYVNVTIEAGQLIDLGTLYVK